MVEHSPYIHPEFLSGTKYCNLESHEIQERALRLTLSDDINTAIRIFNWVRDDVKYAFDYWSVKASETIQRMSGMCANKANLQISLLRAAGIPAGYGVLRIKKEALRTIADEEIFDKTSDVTIHVYCRVFLDDHWVSADATVDKELFDVAYIDVPGWEYRDWNGKDHFQMAQRYIVEDLGTLANIDEFMDITPRFLNDDILKRANKYIKKLRAKSLGQRARSKERFLTSAPSKF